MLRELLTHPLFLTILIAGGGAQLLKILFFLVRYKRLHTLDLVATGGMPSSHAALAVGLAVSVYLGEGLSTAFFITLALASIVLTDAMGVRRTAGQEGLLLHQLIRKTGLKLREPHYALGHTPAQVIVGAVFGFVVAVLIYWLL